MEDMFRLDLRVRPCERVGPNTNSKVVEMLHPEQYSQHPDEGRKRAASMTDTRSSWLPGLRAGENVAKKHCGYHGEVYVEKSEYRARVQDNIMKRLMGAPSNMNGDCPMAPDCWGYVIPQLVPTPTPTGP